MSSPIKPGRQRTFFEHEICSLYTRESFYRGDSRRLDIVEPLNPGG